MNLHKTTRIAKASILTLAMVFGLASCSLDYVVGYVYVTTNKSSPGLINQYAIDFQSGALSAIGMPIAAGQQSGAAGCGAERAVCVCGEPGRLDGAGVCRAERRDAGLKECVPRDGQLSDGGCDRSAGQVLYVTYTYQTGFSAGTPGPGGVSIFAVNSDNSLGSPANVNVGNNPVAVIASNFNHFIYVLDQEPSPNATILGFSQNTSTGALTPVPGTTITTGRGQDGGDGLSFRRGAECAG